MMTPEKDIALQWIERSDYDLSAAASLRKSGHLLYVAFLCQQAVEKMLKALWCRTKPDFPPYTHNLSTLAEQLDLTLSSDQMTLLDRLNRYY